MLDLYTFENNLNGQGWTEIETGIFVAEEDAYEYALERISYNENEKKKFIEWFYSENWAKED